MESELAKTLRAMSDDHRMVPDFSEKLLDIADAIDLQAKEINGLYRQKAKLEHSLGVNESRLKQRDSACIERVKERDAALAEVERLKGELRGIYSDLAASDKARAESNDLWRTER